MIISDEGLKPVLTREEEAALAHRIQHGPDPVGARNELVARNQRLVHCLVKKRIPEHHPEFEDVFQEAMVGLMGAARNFDPSKGTRFSTFARFYIKRNSLRAIQKSTVVRVPRSEWGKTDVRREEPILDETVSSDLSPLEALIAKEEAEERASRIRNCFDELSDDEWLTVSNKFGLDGQEARTNYSPKSKAIYASAINKLRQAYTDRLAD